MSKLSFPKDPQRALRVRRARRRQSKDPSQLDLFDGQGAAKIAAMPVSLEVAVLLDEQGNPMAETYYKELVKEQPSADVLCNLGALFMRQDRIDEAVQTLSEALAIDPLHADAQFNLGNVYWGVQNLTLARLHLRRACRLDPNFIDAHYNMAVVCLEMKKLDESVPYLRIAVREGGELGRLASDMLDKLSRGITGGGSVRSA